HGTYLLEAAEAGMGVAQVIDFMVQDALRSGTLVEVLDDLATDGPSIHAVATPSRARSAGVRAFINFVVEAFRR
ncbi:MAG TPA: LysR substrate-binding domain-containing protein, partial [Kofleriaceae bacterium]